MWLVAMLAAGCARQRPPGALPVYDEDWPLDELLEGAVHMHARRSKVSIKIQACCAEGCGHGAYTEHWAHVLGDASFSASEVATLWPLLDTERRKGCAGGAMRIAAFSGHISDAAHVRAYIEAPRPDDELWYSHGRIAAIRALGILAGRFADTEPQASRAVTMYLVTCSDPTAWDRLPHLDSRARNEKDAANARHALGIICIQGLAYTRSEAARETLEATVDGDNAHRSGAAQASLDTFEFIEDHEELLRAYLGPQPTLERGDTSHQSTP
ncbi:MAG: hypothetical protein ACE366_15100 [Bradymonadia bacterium]